MTQDPMGRGIIKWQPFASIPQQFKGIADIIDNQRKIPRPILNDDEKERINYYLVEAVERKNDVSLVYWVKGRIETVIGKIKKVDQINATVIFIDTYGSSHTLSMISLVDLF
ncbi:YolD-like family protein [Bacillus sp. RG28]|uniref:YolD-like family protein n=1 Tax=Gottfriedia endophytica TaxID=2820819 RepID=A0A940NNF6_9BACI|nr:YolD-like family protein [Gottfriedia endophytica]MBP0723926.1 YolD-like family protein [Gottfriedia endophytica]